MTMIASEEEISLEIGLPDEGSEFEEAVDQQGDDAGLNVLPDLNELTDESSELVVEEANEQDVADLIIDGYVDDSVEDISAEAEVDQLAEQNNAQQVEIAETKLAVLTGEADPILVETFIEEAEQVVADIKQHWNAWQSEQKDWDSFATMRRGYHTLKGSGRFVGAELLSEFGWQLENLCNKCLGKKELISEQKQQLLQMGAETAPILVQQLKNPQAPVEHNVEVLIQQLKDAAAGIENIATQTSSKELESDTVEPANKQQLDEPELEVNSSTENDSLQDELTGIFTAEATQHIKVMRDAVGESDQQSSDLRVDEDLLRTIHTMRGSARTAGVKHISDLCQPLEEIVDLAIKHDITFTGEQKQLIKSCVEQIESDLEKIEHSQTIDESDTQLAEQLGLLNQHLISEYASEVKDGTPVESTGPVNLATASSMVDTAQDRDQELCEIFYEEAEDLLSECQASLQKLKTDYTDTYAVSELQRQFHTLKGSSRMAGLTTIGELSHVTESLLIAISNQLADEKTASGLLQKVLDTLYANIEFAQRGQDLHLNDSLIAEIKRASHQETESDSAKQIVAEEELVIEAAAPEPVSVEHNLESAAQAQALLDDAGESDKSVHVELDLSEGLGADLVAESEQNESLSHSVVAEFDSVASSDQGTENKQAGLKKFVSTPLENVEEVQKAQEKHEVVRVPADVLDVLVNDAGEVNIQRSRMEQVFSSFTANSGEFEQTIGRLREQLRKLDIETEAQILFKHADDQENIADFDPLELDRYSDIQQLSRSLAESVDDLSNIREMFLKNIQDAEDVLVNQKVVTSNLQDNLLSTRMIRFDTIESRLQRIVRQTSSELNKQVDLVLDGGDIEVDRRVLNGVITSIEHILRNSVGHGIELPQQREQLGKPKRGQIRIEIVREGSEISITLKDDGAGIDPQKVKAKAIENGLINQALSFLMKTRYNLFSSPV